MVKYVKPMQKFKTNNSHRRIQGQTAKILAIIKDYLINS